MRKTTKTAAAIAAAEAAVRATYAPVILRMERERDRMRAALERIENEAPAASRWAAIASEALRTE